MADRVRISCINKTDRMNPHERIQNVGGVHNNQRWRLSEDEAIAGIKQGKWSFYTHEGGVVANVIIAKHLGNEYLKTEADGLHPDNLLALSSCPLQ